MASRNSQNKYLKLDTQFQDTISFELDIGQRYAHTSSNGYQVTMASLQPDLKKLPHCACNTINKAKDTSHLDDKVVVIVEHYLKEYILCILDSKKLQQCKLNFMIRPGEQVAFRTIGKIPVQLTGISSNGTSNSKSRGDDKY